MDKLSRDFFWNDNCSDSNKDNHKLYTLAWNKIYRPNVKVGWAIHPYLNKGGSLLLKLTIFGLDW